MVTKKPLGVLLICVLFLISTFASMPVPANDEPVTDSRAGAPELVDKVVLCELFTKSTCGACQSADGAMDRLSDNTEYFPDRVAIIEWHVGPGGTGGDAYTTPVHDQRKAYYGGIPSIPQAAFDGVLWHAGGTIIGANDTYNDREYKERIDLRPNETEVKIEVKKSLTAAGDSGTYNITVSALDTVLNTSLHLRVLLVEDGNETVKNAKFRYTPKEMLDDVPITLQNAGDKVYLNNTFTNQYDMWKISLVVFVQDDTTKEVLQAQTSLFPGNLGPQLNVPSLDFNMLEDTVDDHLDLDEVFFDPQGEAMSFQVQSISATSHMQYSKDKDNVVTFTPEAAVTTQSPPSVFRPRLTCSPAKLGSAKVLVSAPAVTSGQLPLRLTSMAPASPGSAMALARAALRMSVSRNSKRTVSAASRAAATALPA